MPRGAEAAFVASLLAMTVAGCLHRYRCFAASPKFAPLEDCRWAVFRCLVAVELDATTL